MEKLKSWSDLNDHYLQEQIDSVGTALERLQIVINEMHDTDSINSRIEELRAEETMPVAQLLMTFIEKNATPEEIEELKNPTIPKREA